MRIDKNLIIVVELQASRESRISWITRYFWHRTTGRSSKSAIRARVAY
jgi:hypothetical protein